MAGEDDLGKQIRSAAISDDLAKLRQALDQHADINSANQHQNTALHLSALYGYTDLVQALLTAGAACHLTNINGQTALQLAACKGHLAVVELLVKYGSDLNATTQFSGMTALHFASKNGHAKVCQHLLDSHADREILDLIKKNAEYYAPNKDTKRVFAVDKPTPETAPKTTAGESTPTVTPAESSPASLDAEEDGDGKKKKVLKKQSSRAKMEEGLLMDSNWNKNVNHKFEWSEEHKRHMKLSVYDRLAGGGRKK